MRYLLVAFVTCAALFAGSAIAQTGPALLLKPLLGEQEALEGRGDAIFLNSGSTSNGGDFHLGVYEWSGRFREQRENLIPRVGWDLTYLDVNTTDPSIPDKGLTDVSLAAGVELGTYSGWIAALTVGVGYAGDTPFGEGDAWYGKATLVLGRELDPKTKVGAVVDYDGNRTFLPDVPLPGFAYIHEFDPHLSYTLGVPVSAVKWKPYDPVSLEITWTLLDRFDARLDYKLSPQWTVYGALEDRQEAFHIEGLENHDRLLFEQRRVELGLHWQPFEHTSLNLAGGYAWGGNFSSGWDLRKSDSLADFSDEPYVRIGFERRF
jgi:hypothetical protein